MSDVAPTRPVLRYHGGKWRLASWIISHFPPHRVYVEPFGGAASVLLRKPRSYAEVYNDMDGEIVNVFRVLRDPARARELERVLRLTPFAREEFELSYIRDEDPIEQARRTIVRAFIWRKYDRPREYPDLSHCAAGRADGRSVARLDTPPDVGKKGA